MADTDSRGASSGAIGGAIGDSKIGERAGESLGQNKAKVAEASGEPSDAAMLRSNAAVIGTGVAKAIDAGQSTTESYLDQPRHQQPQNQHWFDKPTGSCH